jgi:hypothetical protein
LLSLGANNWTGPHSMGVVGTVLDRNRNGFEVVVPVIGRSAKAARLEHREPEIQLCSSARRTIARFNAKVGIYRGEGDQPALLPIGIKTPSSMTCLRQGSACCPGEAAQTQCRRSRARMTSCYENIIPLRHDHLRLQISRTLAEALSMLGFLFGGV